MRTYHFCYFSVLVLLSLFLFSACQKKEDTLPPLALTVGVADSSILNIDTTIQFATNIPVLWKITQVGGGTLASGADAKIVSYQTPKVAGVYTLQILNQADTTEKIIRTFIVSSKATIFKSLQAGGYVLSFRHGFASTGADQLGSSIPNWWKSCESTIARQLDTPAGRLQSEKIGKAMKLLKIPVGKVLSSEYCRCLQTAQLMNLGVNVETSSILTYYVYDEANRYANTFNLIKDQIISKQNIVFVTHVGFSSIPTNLNGILSILNMGDAAVFRLNPNKANPTVVQAIASADFTELVR